MVALALLTVVMLLGLLVTRQGRLPGLPGFAVSGLHRNLSLLAAAFVVTHILAAVADSYVKIPVAAAVIPLASPYERFWLGLGAVSFDLALAAVVTSLLRRHMSRRAWRAVHLTAYLSWPVAWLHSVFSGGDLRHGPLFFFAVACAIAVGAAAVWRVTAAVREVPRAERVGLLMATAHDRSPARTKRDHRDRVSERTISQ
ncbi:MAG: iron reductase [Actinomycetia bacterium]|nr:iron reductase [Actinomycetes bacterium]